MIPRKVVTCNHSKGRLKFKIAFITFFSSYTLLPLSYKIIIVFQLHSYRYVSVECYEEKPEFLEVQHVQHYANTLALQLTGYQEHSHSDSLERKRTNEREKEEV